MNSTKVRLADQVTSDLQAMIFNKYSPGDRLPVENELAQLFSVSRITIREAISKLSTMGIIDVRQGDGTFVKRLSPASFMQPMLPMLALSDVDLADVFDVRLLIESRAAELAAERITEEEQKKLQNTFDIMEQAALSNEIRKYNELDVQFHKEIAAISGNQVIAVICELITEMIRESIFYSCHIPSHIMNSVIYHNRIYNAIKDHNAPLAAQMMREHLRGGLAFAQKRPKEAGEVKITERE